MQLGLKKFVHAIVLNAANALVQRFRGAKLVYSTKKSCIVCSDNVLAKRVRDLIKAKGIALKVETKTRLELALEPVSDVRCYQVTKG